MKPYVHTLILTMILLNSSLAQLPNFFYPYYQCSINKVPPLKPNAIYAVPLSYIGMKRSNYSVLLKVRMMGDTLYYTSPGVLPTGDSFSFLLKSGNRKYSDTLYFIRRGGDKIIQLAEIRLLLFHPSSRLFSARHDHDFTKAVLASYYNEKNTRRSGGDHTPAGRPVEPAAPQSSPSLLLGYNH